MPTDDVLALIRRAINDPGSVLPREVYDAGDGTGMHDEATPTWPTGSGDIPLGTLHFEAVVQPDGQIVSRTELLPPGSPSGWLEITYEDGRVETYGLAP